MEQSQDWMDEAVGDLEYARSDRERSFYNWACFSATGNGPSGRDRGQPRKDAFAVVKKTLSISAMEPHVYSKEEFEKARGRIARMTEGGIVLFSRT